MTDKVQKIREEVERRLEDAKAGVRQNQNRVKFGIDNKQDLVIWQHLESMEAQLLSFIDSLQEEPKFKTGDRIKPIDSCLGAQRTILEVCDSWYVTDQGTLDFEYEDNWELVKEPAGLDKGKLMDMLEDSLSKETKDSWNERLDKDEEPVSEELEEEVRNFLLHYHGDIVTDEDGIHLCDINESKLLEIANHFANWQKEQFEKNRLAACDKQTEKEAEIEQSFVMGIIEKEHRQPTFDDAIKYGMRLQKEKIMANTTDAMICLPYENKDGGYTHLIDVSRPLPVGDNKIAIIFKED